MRTGFPLIAAAALSASSAAAHAEASATVYIEGERTMCYDEAKARDLIDVMMKNNANEACREKGSGWRMQSYAGFEVNCSPCNNGTEYRCESSAGSAACINPRLSPSGDRVESGGDAEALAAQRAAAARTSQAEAVAAARARAAEAERQRQESIRQAQERAEALQRQAAEAQRAAAETRTALEADQQRQRAQFEAQRAKAEELARRMEQQQRNLERVVQEASDNITNTLNQWASQKAAAEAEMRAEREAREARRAADEAREKEREARRELERVEREIEHARRAAEQAEREAEAEARRVEEERVRRAELAEEVDATGASEPVAALLDTARVRIQVPGTEAAEWVQPMLEALSYADTQESQRVVYENLARFEPDPELALTDARAALELGAGEEMREREARALEQIAAAQRSRESADDLAFSRAKREDTETALKEFLDTTTMDRNVEAAESALADLRNRLGARAALSRGRELAREVTETKEGRVVLRSTGPSLEHPGEATPRPEGFGWRYHYRGTLADETVLQLREADLSGLRGKVKREEKQAGYPDAVVQLVRYPLEGAAEVVLEAPRGTEFSDLLPMPDGYVLFGTGGSLLWLDEHGTVRETCKSTAVVPGRTRVVGRSTVVSWSSSGLVAYDLADCSERGRYSGPVREVHVVAHAGATSGRILVQHQQGAADRWVEVDDRAQVRGKPDLPAVSLAGTVRQEAAMPFGEYLVLNGLSFYTPDLELYRKHYVSSSGESRTTCERGPVVGAVLCTTRTKQYRSKACVANVSAWAPWWHTRVGLAFGPDGLDCSAEHVERVSSGIYLQSEAWFAETTSVGPGVRTAVYGGFLDPYAGVFVELAFENSTSAVSPGTSVSDIRDRVRPRLVKGLPPAPLCPDAPSYGSTCGPDRKSWGLREW